MTAVTKSSVKAANQQGEWGCCSLRLAQLFPGGISVSLLSASYLELISRQTNCFPTFALNSIFPAGLLTVLQNCIRIAFQLSVSCRRRRRGKSNALGYERSSKVSRGEADSCIGPLHHFAIPTVSRGIKPCGFTAPIQSWGRQKPRPAKKEGITARVSTSKR